MPPVHIAVNVFPSRQFQESNCCRPENALLEKTQYRFLVAGVFELTGNRLLCKILIRYWQTNCRVMAGLVVRFFRSNDFGTVILVGSTAPAALPIDLPENRPQLRQGYRCGRPDRAKLVHAND